MTAISTEVSHIGVIVKVAWFLAVSGILVSASACAPEPAMPAKEGEITISLSSSVFRDGEGIPVRYGYEEQDISPPLEWGEPPEGTQAFALIMEDPDAPAGVFTHWVIFNIPASRRALPEAVPTQGQLPDGSLQGKNDFGRTGYSGPYPPFGRPHRYQFTLYALDQPLELNVSISKKQLLSAMEGHVLAQGQLTGTYLR